VSEQPDYILEALEAFQSSTSGTRDEDLGVIALAQYKAMVHGELLNAPIDHRLGESCASSKKGVQRAERPKDRSA
jgi:hypothetical protein